MFCRKIYTFFLRRYSVKKKKKTLQGGNVAQQVNLTLAAPAITYRCQVESQLLHFLVGLLMAWEKQLMMAQGFSPLPFTWKTQMNLLASTCPNPSSCDQLGNEPIDGKISLFLFLSSPALVTLNVK